MKLSVIIVSYNARYYLEQCLHSVLKALENIDGEIIVFDNDSPEMPVSKIKHKFPTVIFVESNENLGFARANNAAVDMAKGEYVLILNPDTMLPENLFEKVLVYADTISDLGALGVRMIDCNGRFHPESKRNIPGFKNTFSKLFFSFFSPKHSGTYYKSSVGEFENAPVEVLTGAFMLIRNSVYRQLGGFDESYFMYGEDIDLSYTLLLNGYKNHYFGESTIIHYKGESTRKDVKYLRRFFGAMQIFVAKYYRSKPFRYFIFQLGLLVRYRIARLLGFFKKEDKVEKVELTIDSMQRIRSVDEIQKETAQILLDGSDFSNQQMIELISQYHQEDRKFYIQPKEMEVIVGDSVVIQLNESN